MATSDAGRISTTLTDAIRCPEGKLSSAWTRQVDPAGTPYVSVWFRKTDCGACPARSLCTRAKHQARHLKLQPRAEHEALRTARERLATKRGRRRYARRAGIEGTISQGVRAFGLRRSRYRGLAKTHLQHVATAAAVNLERLPPRFRAGPRARTPTPPPPPPLPASPPSLPEPTSPTVSDRVRRQACFQAVLVRSIALSVTTSLRMQAVSASLAALAASPARREKLA